MNSKQQILTQQEPRLSSKEAESIIDMLLLKNNIKFKSKGKNQQTIIKNQGKENEERVKYFQLINQVRKEGVCNFLQNDLDKIDYVFGGTFGISSPTYDMKLKAEWAGHIQELHGPFRNTSSEIDLSDDIEFYKEETCFESDTYNFDMCARNYRGYLFSSIALIDSYINRHIILFDFKGRKTKIFLELKESKNSEERIELFVKDFCNFTFDELKKSREWSDFMKLKTLRNEIIHSTSPFMGIELKQVASNLNLSIYGVGSLLKKIQEGQNRISMGFIERVRTSAVVHFNQITFREDGNHLVKKHMNKISR